MNKKNKKWYPTIVAVLLSIFIYQILGLSGVFDSVPVSSAFPDQIFGATVAGDNSYSLENVSLGIDKFRRTYFAWEKEEGANIDIAFTRNSYNLNYDDFACMGGQNAAVNSVSTGDRGDPAIAVDDSGNFVIVWSDSAAPVAASGYDIVFSLFDADCNPVAQEVRVNTLLDGDQTNPAVSMDNDGNFIIVWQGPCDANADDLADDTTGVCARGFNSLAVALDANEYLVNLANAGTPQVNPDVALDPSGSGEFVVVWDGQGADDDDGIYLQGYLNYGTPTSGGNQLINITTTGVQQKPKVAISKGATALRYVVTWEGVGGGDDTGVYARRGTACSSTACAFANTELSVNTTTTGTQSDVQVDADYQGDFVVTWRDGDYGENVRAQFFTFAGALVGVEKSVTNNGFTGRSALGASQVAVSTDGYVAIAGDYCAAGCATPDTATLKWFAQGYESFMYRTGDVVLSQNYESYQIGGATSVDMAVNQSDGSYVVVYAGVGDDVLSGEGEKQGVWFTLVDRDGNIINSKQNTRVHTVSAGDQNNPRVAMSQEDGSFIICFDGVGDTTGDGVGEDDRGIFYRRYDALGNYLDRYDVMVNDSTSDVYSNCDVAAGLSGEFVIVAQNETQDDILISREDGQVAGTDEYLPDTEIDHNYRRSPEISMNTNNDFIIAWETDYWADNDMDIAFIKGNLDQGIDLIAGENSYSSGGGVQSAQDVVLNDDGYWFMVWSGVGTGSDDSEGIYLRQFTLNEPGVQPSSSSGLEFIVNDLTDGAQYSPKITSGGGNDLVVTWLSASGPLPETPFARWIYWGESGFEYKSPDFAIDEMHFSVPTANDFGDAYSAVGMYGAGDLYTLVIAKDSYGYNLYGDERKLIVEDTPILSSTLEQEILSGGRTLVVPDSLQFPSVTASAQGAVTNTVDFEDNDLSDVDYVEAQDLFADGNAYSVTLSISQSFTFTGTATGCTSEIYCIPDVNLEVRNYDQTGDIYTTLFGDSRAFSLNSSTDDYVTLDSQRTLATGTGLSVGRWRFFPQLRLTIPANVPPGRHSAVLTFSLN